MEAGEEKESTVESCDDMKQTKHLRGRALEEK